VQLAVAARTDVGRIRAGNEDSLYADATPSRGLFIVADGMGGHAAGEVASAMAVQIIARELDGLDTPTDDAVARMDRALREANRAIYERTARESDKQGMGTTASVLVLAGGMYLIGQVGDSRIYRLRDGELEQLTRDHSYVQEQVDAGLLTPEQAKYHPYSNVITRCVGANAAVEPDVFAGDVRAGDVFLLASDGLTGMVDDRRLQQLLGSRAAPARVVDALIAEANGRGGLDNITAVLVHVVSAAEPGAQNGRPDAAGDGAHDAARERAGG
jgi:protein phosphatase